MKSSPVMRWLSVMALALILGGLVQSRVEERRTAANLTWTDPGKEPLEAGFLALGGFRGLLADVLWIRAIRHEDSGRYYELKLLCDMILKLQPTFTQVHAYQAFVMAFNLARRGETPENRWYWVHAGLVTLEKGLERNYRNYSLWFELAAMYLDRFGDTRAGSDGPLFRRYLPNFYDLTEEERQAVFLKEEERLARWARAGFKPHPPTPDEHLRYAAYYLWQAMATGTDPSPVRTERLYGDCIERLGHFWSKPGIAPAARGWDDWGSEDWWVELRRRNEERGLSFEFTVAENLRNCMYQEMDFFVRRATMEWRAGKMEAVADMEKKAHAAWERYVNYFPRDNKPLAVIIKRYHDYLDRQTRADLKMHVAEPAAP